MNIFKKLFGKREKEEKKETECWYNNIHEQEKGIGIPPMEAPVSENSYLYTTAQQAAKHQK